MNGIKSGAAALTAAAVMIASLALAPAAFGQGSSVDTYGGNGGAVQSEVGQGANPDSNGPNALNGGGSTGPSASADDAGSLPFTGLDLALAAGGGLLLLGTGMVLARMTPARSHSH